VSCQAKPEECDGSWHTCWECGGEGGVESDDWQDGEDLLRCSLCRGACGWPCPDSLDMLERHCRGERPAPAPGAGEGVEP
jgi:hypothetical protein